MMTQLNIQLTAPIPSKKNSRVNFRGLSLPSKQYREWHKKNLPLVKIQASNSPIDKSIMCVINLNIKFKDKRRRDLDNALSSVLDLLVDAGVIQDDSRKYIKAIYVSGDDAKEDSASVCIMQ